jgi:hypothetical protein
MFSFDSFAINVHSNPFFAVTMLKFALDDLKNPALFEGDIDAVSLCYTTLDGVEIFRLVPLLRNPEPIELRPRFAFPKGQATIRSFTVKLVITDFAFLSLNGPNVVYENQKFLLPSVALTVRDSPFATLKNFTILSPDETFLTFAMDTLLIDHDRSFMIGELISNLVMGWQIVKPLVSRNILDSDSLPIPIH